MQKRFVIQDDSARGVRDERFRQAAIRYLENVTADPAIEVRIEPYKRGRSLAQNRLLHMWMREVSQEFAEHYGDWKAPDVWKEYFKRLFLGQTEHEVNGQIVAMTRKTSKLGVKEFAEFLTQVDLYCGSELGLMLTHPAGIYDEAMDVRASR
ncbi:MAG: recombination protein NinB [Phycisphaerae bacterium]